MKRTPVKSSNIESVGYDSASRTLEVEFKTKTVYSYKDVEPSVALGLQKAKSVGQYFSKYVKNKYDNQKTS
jgi:hypothetical protein